VVFERGLHENGLPGNPWDASSMETADFFLKLTLILVSARVLAEIFALLRLPAVIGEVLAGVVIGPSVLGIIGADRIFVLLGNIGVILLLFQVGVETDVGKLLAVGAQSALVAVTGVVLPFVGAYYASEYLFGMNTDGALFVGGTLVATSIGITLRVLKDIKADKGPVARVVLGAAIIDDIIGVVILALLIQYSMHKGHVELLPSLKLLGFMAVFLAAAPVFGPMVERLLSRVYGKSKTPGVVSTIIVSLILILAVVSHSLGAPDIIGGFAAGLMLSGTPIFKPKVVRTASAALSIAADAEKKITPIGELFIPIFFVMVGVSVNLKDIDFASSGFWAFAAVLTVIALVAKLLAGFWMKGTLRDKVAVGIAMAPRGEVGLIFAQTGLSYGIFGESAYASMVFVVALTTVLAPLLLKPVVKKG
jgi:Na+:H+ antiporter